MCIENLLIAQKGLIHMKADQMKFLMGIRDHCAKPIKILVIPIRRIVHECVNKT
jgi:hypothetical protein